MSETSSNQLPKISVLLPVYNGGSLLVESVQSVLQQSFQEFELLISDDCSTDDSLRYLQSLNDVRVKLIRQEKNLGLFGNLNALMQTAQADVVKIWSQDDVMYPHCLAEVDAFHRRYPDLPLSYCDCDYIDDSGRFLRQYDHSDPAPEVLSQAFYQHVSLYAGSLIPNIAAANIRKSLIKNLGLFRTDLRFSGDFEMWDRIASQFAIGKICKVLIKLRDHTGQLSQKRGFQVQQLKDDLEVMQRLYGRTPEAHKAEARKVYRWRRHVYYFSVLFGMLRQREWAHAKQYAEVLGRVDFLPGLALRWLMVKILAPFGVQVCRPQVARWVKELNR